MSLNNTKIVGLSAALAALVAPAASASAPTVKTDVAQDPSVADATVGKTLKLSIGEELMNFTVSDGSDGTIVAQHESHASHASHASHSSHMSSSF